MEAREEEGGAVKRFRASLFMEQQYVLNING